MGLYRSYTCQTIFIEIATKDFCFIWIDQRPKQFNSKFNNLMCAWLSYLNNYLMVNSLS